MDFRFLKGTKVCFKIKRFRTNIFSWGGVVGWVWNPPVVFFTKKAAYVSLIIADKVCFF